MKCPKCGKIYYNHMFTTICRECGYKFKDYCPICETRSPNSEFCNKCGGNLVNKDDYFDARFNLCYEANTVNKDETDNLILNKNEIPIKLIPKNNYIKIIKDYCSEDLNVLYICNPNNNKDKISKFQIPNLNCNLIVDFYKMFYGINTIKDIENKIEKSIDFVLSNDLNIIQYTNPKIISKDAITKYFKENDDSIFDKIIIDDISDLKDKELSLLYNLAKEGFLEVLDKDTIFSTKKLNDEFFNNSEVPFAVDGSYLRHSAPMDDYYYDY